MSRVGRYTGLDPFEGPEALTGTAEEVLPALCADLQLDIGLRHWRNVTFRQQRSFIAALLGYRLGPNDDDSSRSCRGSNRLLGAQEARSSWQ